MATWEEISGQQTIGQEDTTQRKRRRGLRAAPDGPRAWWDVEPWLLPHRGRVLKCYGIRTVAYILGVSPVTARTWERLGLLPRAPLRLIYPTAEWTRRIYDEVMMEALVVAVERHGVRARRRPTPAFFKEVETAWLAARAALGGSTFLTVAPLPG